MSILIIQLPARTRPGVTPSAGDPASAVGGEREFAYVLSADGMSVARQGRAAANLLPRADTVVAVMAETDVSWHQLTVPKAPASRMRAALASMLEDAVLDDPDDIHLAVAPQSKVGEPTWVAVMNHAWLTGQLMALEKAKIRVERVVPAMVPDDPPVAYFSEQHGGESVDAEGALHMLVTWSSPEGVSSWPAAGAMSRALLPEPLPVHARCFASPAVAAPAERWLGHSVTVLTPAEHALHAARSLWNLLQFELTPRSKGLHAINDQWRAFLSPQWRPARVGLVVLAVAQVLGLNLWAWQQKHLVQQKKAAMVALLKDTHPQITAVLDAPVQMQRETEALRAAAGQPGDNDLEALMGALASAWPQDKPTGGLQYDGTSLSVMPPAGWNQPDLDGLRDRLSAAGYSVDIVEGRIVMRRPGRG
ncbi:MAG: hypothetical protein RI907_2123 [Pseudomonadota bacterium]|jgi:general secretion pathway protein L